MEVKITSTKPTNDNIKIGFRNGIKCETVIVPNNSVFEIPDGETFFIDEDTGKLHPITDNINFIHEIYNDFQKLYEIDCKNKIMLFERYDIPRNEIWFEDPNTGEIIGKITNIVSGDVPSK